MRGVQGTPEEIVLARLGPLRMRLGVAWALREMHAIRHCGDIRGRTVAKIIEFYIPSTFHKSGKWVPRQQRGKLIEFVLETKKTA